MKRRGTPVCVLGGQLNRRPIESLSRDLRLQSTRNRPSWVRVRQSRRTPLNMSFLSQREKTRLLFTHDFVRGAPHGSPLPPAPPAPPAPVQCLTARITRWARVGPGGVGKSTPFVYIIITYKRGDLPRPISNIKKHRLPNAFPHMKSLYSQLHTG